PTCDDPSRSNTLLYTLAGGQYASSPTVHMVAARNVFRSRLTYSSRPLHSVRDSKLSDCSLPDGCVGVTI
ncbi:MAG: hypothetical protein ACRDJE_26585, partial [Dehalococcoidia bacterium]